MYSSGTLSKEKVNSIKYPPWNALYTWALCLQALRQTIYRLCHQAPLEGGGGGARRPMSVARWAGTRGMRVGRGTAAGNRGRDVGRVGRVGRSRGRVGKGRGVWVCVHVHLCACPRDLIVTCYSRSRAGVRVWREQARRRHSLAHTRAREWPGAFRRFPPAGVVCRAAMPGRSLCLHQDSSRGAELSPGRCCSLGLT